MKKVALSVLVIALAFALAACGGSSTAGTTDLSGDLTPELVTEAMNNGLLIGSHEIEYDQDFTVTFNGDGSEDLPYYVVVDQHDEGDDFYSTEKLIHDAVGQAAALAYSLKDNSTVQRVVYNVYAISTDGSEINVMQVIYSTETGMPQNNNTTAGLLDVSYSYTINEGDYNNLDSPDYPSSKN